MPTCRLAQDVGEKKFSSYPVSFLTWLSENEKYGEMSKELFRYSKAYSFTEIYIILVGKSTTVCVLN
jgi:hypothetical protein